MNKNITKQELLYEFWRIYEENGIKDALVFLDNNNYYYNIQNRYYDNYINEITTTNALDSMLSDLNLS